MIKYPQYRKLSNGKSFYKIDNHNKLVELKQWGKYYEVNLYEASIFPDYNWIQDLLLPIKGVVKIDQVEYEKWYQYLVEKFELMK